MSRYTLVPAPGAFDTTPLLTTHGYELRPAPKDWDHSVMEYHDWSGMPDMLGDVKTRAVPRKLLVSRRYRVLDGEVHIYVDPSVDAAIVNLFAELLEVLEARGDDRRWLAHLRRCQAHDPPLCPRCESPADDACAACALTGAALRRPCRDRMHSEACTMPDGHSGEHVSKGGSRWRDGFFWQPRAEAQQ